MCFHDEQAMNFFLKRRPQYSAVAMRSVGGRLIAGWLVNPTNVVDVAVCIASLKDWHQLDDTVIDLTRVNRDRASRGLPPLDEEGVPVYRGAVATSAEDTPIGQEIKDLLAEFASRAYEPAFA
jgi:V8-like Glu-specific endopeptidase